MRQRVIKLLAAFLLTVAGLVATGVAAGAAGQDDSTSVFSSVISVVTPDSTGWE